MTLAGKDRLDWEKRREATREAAAKSQRSPGAAAMGIAKNLAQPTRPGFFNEENMAPSQMLAAQCKRLAGRSTVIGNTVFAFDKDGICRVINHSNVIYDFAILLRQNGVIVLDPITLRPLDPTVDGDPVVEAPEVPPVAPPVDETTSIEPPAPLEVVPVEVTEPPVAPPTPESPTAPFDPAVTASETVKVDEKASVEAPVADKDTRRKPATKK